MYSESLLPSEIALFKNWITWSNCVLLETRQPETSSYCVDADLCKHAFTRAVNESRPCDTPTHCFLGEAAGEGSDSASLCLLVWIGVSNTSFVLFNGTTFTGTSLVGVTGRGVFLGLSAL